MTNASEGIPKELLVKEGVYDFVLGEDYGFTFEEYLNGLFESSIVKETYLQDFLKLRQFHIESNYDGIKKIVHKFKSSFLIFGAKKIGSLAQDIQSKIDNGDNDIDEAYIELILKMLEFFDCIVSLCEKLGKPLDQASVQEFYEKNKECNEAESSPIKARLGLEGVQMDTASQNVCCTGGCSVL